MAGITSARECDGGTLGVDAQPRITGAVLAAGAGAIAEGAAARPLPVAPSGDEPFIRTTARVWSSKTLDHSAYIRPLNR